MGVLNVLFFTVLVTIEGINLETSGDVSAKISPPVSPSSDLRITQSAEIQSSFDDARGSAKFDVDSSILQQIEVPPELGESVEEIVLTIADSPTYTLEQSNSSESEGARAYQKDENTTPTPEHVEDVLELPENTTTEATPTVPVAPEDIPSFSEWTQQQLAERKKDGRNITERIRTSKVRSKNYASPDCGAKIVAANPEAVSASSVLTSSRDEYMLNHCTAKIWFIVELCEAIQAKQLDLASFELYSSAPKDFSVYIGTRFPSRDWSNIGRFMAQDVREIQTFDLNPQLFGKYLKVEVHSHYGKEHYCPLSLTRVFGTSEYEVLATEDDRQNDDDDDLGGEEAGDIPKNLLSSATDAVLSIVKKATAPFLKIEEPSKAERMPPSLCVSPRYRTVCYGCSQHTFDNVYYLLSCQQDSFYQLTQTPYVRQILMRTNTCSKYGLDFIEDRSLPARPDGDHYLTALLKESYVIALCNVLGIVENRLVVNMSLSNPGKNFTMEPSLPAVSILPHSPTCDAPKYSTSASVQENSSRDFSQQIRPTKTLGAEEAKKLVKDTTGQNVIGSSVQPTVQQGTVLPSSVAPPPTESTDDAAKVSFAEDEEVKEPDASIDAFLKDLSELEKSSSEPASSTPPPGPPKDSIFLRLANRIKALELNMSLSSSYLEELSRRYRLQFELLGQTVNSTAIRLEQQVRLEELRNKRRDEELAALRKQLTDASKELQKLLKERDSWIPRPTQLIWLALELLVVWYYLQYWRRTIPAEELQHENKPVIELIKGPRRRNSVECVTGHVLPVRPMERRPSDEALEITVSTVYSTVDRKRKKKRKENSRKTSAVAVKRKKSDTPSSIEREQENHGGLVRTSSEPPSTPLREVTGNLNAVSTSNRFAAFASPETRARTPELVRRFSSPAFMRTAVSSRASRSGNVPSHDGDTLKKESGFKKYMRKIF